MRDPSEEREAFRRHYSARSEPARAADSLEMVAKSGSNGWGTLTA
jgi:hypothetical protein